MLANPWRQISYAKGSFVLNEDRHALELFNKKASYNHMYRTDLPPEPYIGNPITADIFLLALNPGYEGGEQEYLVKNPALHQALLDNLEHKNIEYPLFFLENRFNESPGAKWWARILKPVLDVVKNNKLLLSQKICELQLFPYHSTKYKHSKGVSNSQNYTFELLRNAIREGKMIIILRSKKMWLDAVPELIGNYCKLNSSQNVIISEKNLGKIEFEKLISVINN